MFRNRRSRGPRHASLLTLASLSLSLPLASRALAAAVTWTSPSNDSWNDPASWSSSPALPGLADDVLISQPSPVTVTLDYGNQTVNSLTDNNTLTLTGGSLAVTTTLQVNGTFNLQGGTLQNTALNANPSGTINLYNGTLSNVSLAGTVLQASPGSSLLLSNTITNNANWSQSTTDGINFLSLANTTTLNGNGTLTLSNCNIAANSGNATLNIGAGQTLQGGGNVASGVSIHNSGVLDANSPTIPLSLNSLTNNGTVESTNGATLTLTGSSLTNTQGVISATSAANGTPSTITISAKSITGGQFLTDAASQIVFAANTTLSNLSISGNLGFSNGTVYLVSGGFAGPVTLSNVSRVNVSSVFTTNVNWSFTSSSCVSLPGGSFVNRNVILSTNGATVNFFSSIPDSIDNANGTFEAISSASGTPSKLILSPSTITGGQFLTDAASVIGYAATSGNLSNVVVNGNIEIGLNAQAGYATLSNDTFNGSVGQNDTVSLKGTLTNNANWTQSSNVWISVDAPSTLNGNGSITFAGSSQAIMCNSNLTIAGNQILYGSGSILLNSSLINNGTVNVSGACSTVGIFGMNSTMTNSGILQSTNGGHLTLGTSSDSPSTSVIGNNNGTISANGNGSVVSVVDLTINGGQISTDATGVISLGLGAVLSNVTVTGNIQISGSATLANDTLNGTIAVNPGDFVSMAGTITNNAVLSENYGQVVGFADGTILNGNGTINFSGGLIIPVTGIASLTIGPAQTLSGNVTITNYLISNAGTIEASPNTFLGNMIIDSPAGTFVNTGLIEAIGSSSLYLNSSSSGSFLNNSNGTLGAYGTSSTFQSTLTVSNITVSGGQLLTNAFGSISLSQSSLINASVSGNLGTGYAVLFSNDTFAGNVSVGGPLTLSGTIVNNANWPVLFGAPEQITLAGNVTINGKGTIGLDGAVVSSANGTLATLTIGPNQTIQGSSNSTFSSSLTVINTGTIATATPFSNSIIFNGPFTNTGFVDVNSVGSISFSSLTNLSNGILTGGTWEVATFGILTAPGPITTNAATIILNNSSANGTSLANLTLNQANLTLTNASRFSAAANFTNTGNLIIGSFSTFSAPQLLLNAGTLAGTGTIAAPVLAGSSPNTIHPGIPASLTPGTLTLQSLSTNPNTTLAFNLLTPASSTSPSVNDRLVISSPNGLTFNGGSLQLTSAPTGPAALGYYQLIQYTGSFTGLSSLLLPTSTNNLVYSLDTARDPNSIDLHIGLLGDANDDGKVDLSDLNTLLNNLGSPTASWTAGNFDGNPTIDLTDLNDVLNNLGTTYTTPSTAAAPEPASLLIALPLAALLIARRKTVAAAT